MYGAYTTDGKHVRLFRYGGGTVAVGSAKTPAKDLGVATSLEGRIWVMWADDSGAASPSPAPTRPSRASSRSSTSTNSGSMYRILGDGRLGPLDVLVDQIPNVSPIQPPGMLYARTRAVLSAAFSVKPIKNKKLAVIGHKPRSPSRMPATRSR